MEACSRLQRALSESGCGSLVDVFDGIVAAKMDGIDDASLALLCFASLRLSIVLRVPCFLTLICHLLTTHVHTNWFHISLN
jgi:hypothetical protein